MHKAAPASAAHHRTVPAHRGGLALALGALLLLVLVGISLGLLRRVTRLQREVTGTAA